MPIDERELRSRLEETAARAEAPRFTAEDLAARVRRIRRTRRNRALIGAAVLVPAVAAAVAIPLLSGGSGEPAVISSPAVAPPGPSYRVTVNGQASVPGPAGAREYYVTANEKLTITVDVTVPAHPPITALLIGISDGVLGPPMSQVLASSTRAPLRPGVHRFVLHWTAPAGLGPANVRVLEAQWRWSGVSQGYAGQAIAEFVAPPGPAFSAAAVGRLRASMLRAAASCGDPRPTSIVAVRTTLGTATAEMGGGETGSNSAEAVYLVVMEGDFTGQHATMPPCVGAPPGHYFMTMFDASTFMMIAERLTGQPPPVPLQNLGPVRNLT
jgi:hypothetical protein